MLSIVFLNHEQCGDAIDAPACVYGVHVTQGLSAELEESCHARPNNRCVEQCEDSGGLMLVACTRCECHIAAFPLDVFSAISLWLTPLGPWPCPRRWNNFSKGCWGTHLAPSRSKLLASTFQSFSILHSFKRLIHYRSVRRLGSQPHRTLDSPLPPLSHPKKSYNMSAEDVYEGAIGIG